MDHKTQWDVTVKVTDPGVLAGIPTPSLTVWPRGIHFTTRSRLRRPMLKDYASSVRSLCSSSIYQESSTCQAPENKMNEISAYPSISQTNGTSGNQTQSKRSLTHHKITHK